MSKRKYMPVSEFREAGLLWLINQQILHPLGLALEVTVHGDGTELLSGIWDGRDDPEGYIFDEEGQADGAQRLAAYMCAQGDRALFARGQALGFVYQPVKAADGEEP